MTVEERIQRIEYKGHTINYFNYSGLNRNTEQEFLDTIQAATDFFFTLDNNQLTIVDVRNAFTTSKIMAKWKETTKQTQHLMKKNAVLGITGVKAVLLDAIVRFSKANIKMFDTKEEALEWLISDE